MLFVQLDLYQGLLCHAHDVWMNWFIDLSHCPYQSMNEFEKATPGFPNDLIHDTQQ